MRRVRVALLATLLCVGCARAGPTPASPAEPSQSASAAAPKRIVAATKNVPSFLYYKLHPGPTAGAEEIGDLLDSGLVITDDSGLLRPLLGEAVPSLDNGLWQVFPDGSMQTTLKIRPRAVWHDGAPLTADDLVFTAALAQDRELAVFHHVGFDSIERLEIVDPRTVLVHWKRPYIEADALFSTRFTLPLPAHLLQDPYTESKDTFLELPFWGDEFIGTGPFKVHEYVRGSFLNLRANTEFAPGRPRVDEIEVRFITDDNAFIANLLSGAVDFTLGRGSSLEQALMVRDQWTGGSVEFKALDSWVTLYPQFVNPSPQVVANAQFRRALVQAIDRQEIVDTIQHGQTPVADGNISPHHPYYKQIEPSVVHYGYDPRQSAAILQDLGYARGADGAFRDAGGQPLALELRGSTVLDILPKSIYAVADYWKQLGVPTTPEIRPTQLAADPEWTATFPAFALQRQTGSHRFLPNLRSSQARIPERNYTGLNVARYMDPDMDALIDRYVTTIPITDRVAVIAQIEHRITDEAIWMTLFFDTEPALISNRLVNVHARGEDSNHAWNAYEWDVR
ncbi:MAG TPA: ABC transporter substrate-binding protein [Chloroflexota bacterium]|nr:ABC transporter substrate-binding protein [Chloroflexota bacterium]